MSAADDVLKTSNNGGAREANLRSFIRCTVGHAVYGQDGFNGNIVSDTTEAIMSDIAARLGIVPQKTHEALGRFTAPPQGFVASDDTSPHGAREVVARALAEQCDSGSADYWDMWVKDADAAIAALKPIIVAEIRAWAERGLSVTSRDSAHPVEKGAILVLDTLLRDADEIASRICGGEA